MYVTPLQLAESPGARELADVATSQQSPSVDPALMDATLRGTDRSAWTTDDTALADDAMARIQSAIDDAGAMIEGYLAQRGYTLPLNPVPGIVARWARAIVRYTLHKDRISDPKADPVARDYADAQKFLAQTAAGTFSIGITTDAAAPGGLGEVAVSAPPTRIGCETLDEYSQDYPFGSARRPW